MEKKIKLNSDLEFELPFKYKSNKYGCQDDQLGVFIDSSYGVKNYLISRHRLVISVRDLKKLFKALKKYGIIRGEK
jgi:hypothetical protein